MAALMVGVGRLCGYMQRALLNNQPNNVAAYFPHAVEEYGCCPVDLVTDLGTEID